MLTIVAHLVVVLFYKQNLSYFYILENKLVMSLFFFFNQVFLVKKIERRKVSNIGKNIISPKNDKNLPKLSENWQF